MKEMVYLIGCRAVGKSSIGKKLADKFSCTFLDTDELITRNCGKSVAEIVKENGWQGFRNKEKEILEGLEYLSPSVVATGGGAVLHKALWPRLKRQGVVVWLTASLDVLCARLQKDLQTDVLRPSLTGKDLCLELEDVLKERLPLYTSTADYTVDTGTLDMDEAVDVILRYLERIG